MDPLLTSLRLLHIVFGVFWTGAHFYNALFLAPAMRDAGPAGDAVTRGLLERRLLDVMPAAALVTIASGCWLYWVASVGLQRSYVLSRPGLVYGLGTVATLIAFGIALGFMRPATLRAMSLLATDGDSAEKEGRNAVAQAIFARVERAEQGVAALLLVAVATMAVARYA